jgi:hypothetical protein
MVALLLWAPWILAYAILVVAGVTVLNFFWGWWSLARAHRLDPQQGLRGIKIDSVAVRMGWPPLAWLPALSCKVIVTDEGFVLGKRYILRALCPEIYARWQDIDEILMLDQMPEYGVAVKLRDQWPVLYLDGVAAAKIWRAC